MGVWPVEAAPGRKRATNEKGPPTKKGHQRDRVTVFGTVTVTRIAYRAPGAANLYPADAALNLPEGKHSHGLRRLAALEAARVI